VGGAYHGRLPAGDARPHARWIREAGERLCCVTTAPREEAGRLLAHALGLSRRSDLFLVAAEREGGGSGEAPHRLTPEVRARFDAFVAERAAGVPLQYVLGYADFHESRFAVRRGVFIPRPETELLVDAVLRALPQGASRVLELGTGSGAILVSVLRERPDVLGFGVDVSTTACEVTLENARRLRVEERLTLLESDLFARVPPGVFDVVVSNPPYVATGDVLPLDVSEHEPHVALYAGLDGLSVVRRIVDEAPAWLVPRGNLLLEIGETQGERVRALLSGRGFGEVVIAPDLAGRDRIASGVWTGES
jgi:release factor glutamine methyltransferase